MDKVLCPVCKGDKQLSYQSKGGCQCCMGEGVITKEKDRILAQIRKDLARRLGSTI
jgi:DnaJ-class molecular chaperone